MAFRLYEDCKNCKENRTSGWGFGIRKKGGCLFPDNVVYGIVVSDGCPHFKPKGEK